MALWEEEEYPHRHSREDTMQRLQAQEPNLHHPVKIVPLLILNMSMLLFHKKESKAICNISRKCEKNRFVFLQKIKYGCIGAFRLRLLNVDKKNSHDIAKGCFK